VRREIINLAVYDSTGCIIFIVASRMSYSISLSTCGTSHIRLLVHFLYADSKVYKNTLCRAWCSNYRLSLDI